jgi:hypothetical protein
VSNGASIVLEQAAAKPEARVFLRPSVIADDEDDTVGCLAADCDCDGVATFVTFTLVHPPPLGTVGMMDNFAIDICTERKKHIITTTLLEEEASGLVFFILLGVVF